MKYIVIILVVIFLEIFLYQKNTHSIKKPIDINATKVQKGENMDVNTKVEEEWQRLFDYYEKIGLLSRKCKGAKEEEIVKFEKKFQVTLPQSFVDSFMVCDERYILDTSKKRGWFGEDDMYSLNDTKYGWYNLFQVNSQMATYAKDIGWNKKWIKFYDYGTWFSAVLDTVTGKIYCHENETGKYVLWAKTYEEWLKMAVDEVLEYGELRLEIIEKLLGIEE